MLKVLDSGPPGAPVLVLIHAFPLNGRLWESTLAALTPGWRVVAPHLRGFGSADPPAVLTMASAARDVLDTLDALGVKHAVVGGMSMGGYVALEVWHQAAQRCRGVVLLDSRAGADSETGRAGRETFAQNALSKGLGWVADDMLPKLLSRAAPEALVARVRGMVMEAQVEGVAAAQRGMAQRRDFLPLLPQMKVPFLALVGEHDVVTPPAESLAMAAAVPNGKAAVVPGAAHLAHLENAEAVHQALRGFLAPLS